MYTLLIVDDEPLVRNSISTIIDWDSLGFTEIYQAEDGIEALEACRKYKVDLVLTDIVMPFMDGLELSKELGEEFPDIHVVVLTGHEEFEYAKQSVDLGVKNYILKPVGAATLYGKMKEICKKLNIEASQKQYIAEMKLKINQSMPALREKFLYTLACTPNGTPYNLEERIQTLELPLQSKSYLTAIVEVDLTKVEDTDQELFIFTGKNITIDCIGQNHCVFDNNNNKVVIVFCLDEFGDEGKQIAYSTMQVIQKAIYSVLKVPITCALGSVVEVIDELSVSFNEAERALDCMYSLGDNKVYDVSDLDYIEKSFYYPFEGMQRLIYCVKFLTDREIREAVGEIRKILLLSKNLSHANIKMVFIELITSLLKELSSVKQVATSVWNEGFSLYQGLENMQSVPDIICGLQEFAVHVSAELHQQQSNSSQLIIQKTMKYIEEHYGDESISLSSAADHVSVSTGYLSALFKKEGKMNFVEYLTKVRMEKAMELLKNTDKKTYEIAYAIGFANPHYFSISFKKYSGMSPSDYRGTHVDRGNI